MVFSSDINSCISAVSKMAEKHKINLCKGIEFFCGDGSLYTIKLAGLVNELTGIDVRANAGRSLAQKCANVQYICTDAIRYIAQYQDQKYDILSVDNPLCVFGMDYCEHFEVLEYIRSFIEVNRKFILAFDYVTTPYNACSPNNEQWLRRRTQYYLHGSYNIDSNYAMDFYRNKFLDMGLDVLDMMSVCREKCDENCYFHMMICVLERKRT